MSSRNVLVAGANRGIGLAIAQRFRDDGDQVVILTRAGEDVHGLRAVAGDVTDSGSVNVAFRAAEEICGGPMDIVVANADITDDLGGRGITANVVAPGLIETEMTSVLPQERQDAYRAASPAGRFARPEEVAAAVSFLASPEAAYINGVVLPVAGGLGIGH